jgi:HSP20 family protein
MLTHSLLGTPTRSSFRGYHPVNDFFRFQQEVDRLFSGVGRRTTGFPAVNIWTNADEAVVKVELPGFTSDEVEVALEQDKLKLMGARKDQELQDGENLRQQERWNGRFERTLKLPFAVESDNVKAEFSNGVLLVKLPKAEDSKAKRIAVKVS